MGRIGTDEALFLFLSVAVASCHWRSAERNRHELELRKLECELAAPEKVAEAPSETD